MQRPACSLIPTRWRMMARCVADLGVAIVVVHWSIRLPWALCPSARTASTSHTVFRARDPIGALFVCGVCTPVAYTLRRWRHRQTISVMNIDTRAVLDDELSWVKFSGIAWLHDSSGVHAHGVDVPLLFEPMGVCVCKVSTISAIRRRRHWRAPMQKTPVRRYDWHL